MTPKIPLYADLQKRLLTDASGSALTLPSQTLGDKVLFSLHSLDRDSTGTASEVQLNLRSLRASIGSVMTSPDNGTFTLGGIHGIVLGYGYDLGAVTGAQFVRDWTGLIPPCHLARLLSFVGITGPQAEAIAPMLRDIEISEESAQVAWVLTELTRLERELAATFPGVEYLPDIARAALVSLIASRGINLAGPRHREMLEIRDRLETLKSRDGEGWKTDCRIIAHLIRCMKRLYPLPPGLLARARRDAEADLLDLAAA